MRHIDDLSGKYNIRYEKSAKGWQNGGTFKRYIQYINEQAKKKKVRFAFLVDNASSHVSAAKELDPTGSTETVFKFESVDILFLPPNCTSDMQPCDMGIIRSFKCKYRKLQLQRLFELLEDHMLLHPDRDVKFKIENVVDMKLCLEMIEKSMNAMDRNVIKRCWAKSKILPDDLQEELNGMVDRGRSINEDIGNELTAALEQVDVQHLYPGEEVPAFSANELIDQDAFEPIDETEVSDDSIIEQLNIMNLNSGSQTSATSDGSLSDVSDLTNLTNMDTVMERNKKRKPSHTELAHALKTFTTFFETNEDSEDEEAQRITGAIGILRNAMPALTKQSSITSFFI